MSVTKVGNSAQSGLNVPKVTRSKAPPITLMDRLSNDPRGIAIVGAGIGGIAAAVAMQRAGVRVTVYEKTTGLQEAGSGIMLWPNATRVLRELGVLEQVAAKGGPTTNFLVRSSSGRVLMDLALGDFDVPALGVRRADLLAALIAALPPEAIRLGYDFDHFSERADGVKLHFKNFEAIEHAAIVGADGIRSQVRAQLFGASHPIYRGYTIWRGLATYRGDAVIPGSNSESWGRGQRFGILNTGNGSYTWYGTANVSAFYTDPPCGRKLDLLQRFRNWHDPVLNLIQATDEVTILRHSARDLAPLRSWGRGRVTLLGDSAHPCTPNLGQGGCMALEDALALSKCIKQESSAPVALRRYESLRRPRTRHVQQRSRLMGLVGQWRHPLLLGGRHVVTPLLPAMIFERNMRRIYSYAV